VSLGACNTSGSSTLFVNPAPQTPTVIQMSGYLATYIIANSFQWYLNGSPISGATLNTYVPTVDGYYSVWAANGNCMTSSQSLLISVLGLKEFTSVFSNITIGPNPTKDEFYLTFEDSINEEISYEIQNNLGQKIVSASIKPTSGNKVKIATNSLSNGVYFLKLKQGNKQAAYKFIKQ
jgi:hypothetical protein